MNKLTNSAGYLFVYGTLRKQYQLDLLNNTKQSIRFFKYGRINGELYDIGEYPGATKTTLKRTIQGEVLSIEDESILHLLDDYEGFTPGNIESSLFVREQASVELDNGDFIIAWVYWYNQSTAGKQRIEETDYFAYLQNKKTV